jgi:hypothetical protein
MSGIFFVILALVGVAAVVALCVAGLAALYEEWLNPPPVGDPYRDGLDASARISAVAFEAERAMFAAVEDTKED